MPMPSLDSCLYALPDSDAPHVARTVSDFESELLAALTMRPRAISPKFFYDAAGSRLFDRICDQPEYYPTRTECAILAEHAPEMTALMGPDVDLVEFGAGSTTKVRFLLDALRRPSRFIPVDISGEHLHASSALLRKAYPGLTVEPLVADFTQPLSLPPSRQRIGFFPGSSIGNFTPPEAVDFLRTAAQSLRCGGLLIGVDLVKDPSTLHRAYNDAAGVTAAFNRNLLVRANRELGTDFVPEQFAHYAFYEPRHHRVEMHLVSQCKQTVLLGTQDFEFTPGESLHTESSYKFSVEGFQSLALRAGLQPSRVWVDAQGLFSVHWLTVAA
jgi:dimethylhistidine N-methyltransferase